MDPVQAVPIHYNPYGAPPPLPAGWIEYRTPTGQPYWYNTFTTQSSWVYPVMAPIPPAPLHVQQQQAPPKRKKQIKKKIPGTHWLLVLTHDGYEFYYDRETKKSIWEMPEELKEPIEELKRLEEEEKKKEELRKKQELEEEETRKRKAILEAEEAEQEAKRVKLEEEIIEAEDDENMNEKEQELDATEMTEEDIMWQLQQMAEAEVAEGGEEKEEEYNEDDIQQQLQLQHQEEQQQENEEKKEEPAAAAGTAAVNEKPKLSEEECIQKFNELLEERNISPFAVYSAEFPQLMTDPRFSLVPHNKQKILFNKYCNALGEKIKIEKSKNSKKPEDEFKELLQDKVITKIYWDDFRRKYKDDSRFKSLKVTKEKEALFKDHIKNNLNKRSSKKDPVQDYIELLKSTKEIHEKGIRWRDAKKILGKDDRYHAIDDKDKREDLFRDYLDELF